jgi:hypothetical protein
MTRQLAVGPAILTFRRAANQQRWWTAKLERVIGIEPTTFSLGS